MRKIFLPLMLLLTGAAYSQQRPAYDSTLARQLGADEYGMKQYIMVLLKPGPAQVADSTRTRLLQGHLKNIGRLAREGKLLVAGPFLDNGPLSGIFIFNVSTVSEAQALVATDPAVHAGLFVPEMHPWYGSAAMMEIPAEHYRFQKKSFVE